MVCLAAFKAINNKGQCLLKCTLDPQPNALSANPAIRVEDVRAA